MDLNESEMDLNESEMDLNESEMDLNECEHFLKANLDRSEIDLSWINLTLDVPFNFIDLYVIYFSVY